MGRLTKEEINLLETVYYVKPTDRKSWANKCGFSSIKKCLKYKNDLYELFQKLNPNNGELILKSQFFSLFINESVLTHIEVITEPKKLFQPNNNEEKIIKDFINNRPEYKDLRIEIQYKDNNNNLVTLC